MRCLGCATETRFDLGGEKREQVTEDPIVESSVYLFHPLQSTHDGCCLKEMEINFHIV